MEEEEEEEKEGYSSLTSHYWTKHKLRHFAKRFKLIDIPRPW